MFDSWKTSKPDSCETDPHFSVPISSYDKMKPDELTRLANEGNSEAMFSLAQRLQAGVDVPLDLDSGHNWLLRAANVGHTKSMCRLAHMYATGTGNQKKNVEEAAKWAKQAADTGAPWGIFWYAYLHQFELNQPKAAQSLLSKINNTAKASAASGDLESIIALSAIYGEKWSLFYKPHLAAHWCRKAALQGDAYAIESLAWMYNDGIGVKRNLTLARIWFTRAVERNCTRAITPLAIMFAKGVGGSLNHSAAISMLTECAERGDANARTALTKISTQVIDELPLLSGNHLFK